MSGKKTERICKNCGELLFFGGPFDCWAHRDKEGLGLASRACGPNVLTFAEPVDEGLMVVKDERAEL